nr:MAG TPA: hypothetical protein [Caudoviricetes sp.]
MSLPLPAGNYKKSVSNPRTSYGDGKNSEVTISKGLLKQMALNAFGIASITNFSLALYAHKQVRLTWAKPTRGLWSGTRLVFKYDSMPTSTEDGFYKFDSADVHFETGRLEERQLYVRAYSYVTTNEGRWYDDGKVSATIRVSGISGAVSFGAGAGTWTVPANVYKIRYILVGHGGDAGRMFYTSCATGGGGGGYFTTGYMNVTPGQALPWVVPTATGQPTVLNSFQANSGTSGNRATYGNRNMYGGAGGSGGGAAYFSSGFYGAGCGGTDGGDGQECWWYDRGRARRFESDRYTNVGGTGQHTSTRGFNGVLYSGGGGGGGAVSTTNKSYPEKGAGLGGPGGGGNCTSNSVYGETEAAGTDGLGGGGGGLGTSLNSYNYANRYPNGVPGGRGGTGCIYIAWGSLMNDGS